MTDWNESNHVEVTRSRVQFYVRLSVNTLIVALGLIGGGALGIWAERPDLAGWPLLGAALALFLYWISETQEKDLRRHLRDIGRE